MLQILLIQPVHTSNDRFHNVLGSRKDIHIIESTASRDSIIANLPRANLILIKACFGKELTGSLISLIREYKPKTQILIIDAVEKPDIALDFIEAGASGYILETESPEMLVSRIHSASNGEVIISPEMTAQLIKRISQISLRYRRNGLSAVSKQNRLQSLSSREKQVLDLLSQGHTNDEIAQQLFITCGTVKNHVHHILKKLNVTNREQATSFYRSLADTDLLPLYS